MKSREKSTAKRVNPDNVFLGPDGLKAYLTPACNPPTPLVEAPPSINRLYGDGVRLWLKLPPILSWKMFGAHSMLEKIARTSRQNKKTLQRLVLNSSGNMALNVSVQGRVQHGIEHTLAIVPDDIAPGKWEALRLAGAGTMTDTVLPGNHTAMSYARALGGEEGSAYVAQYEDFTNVDGYDTLIRQLLLQTNGDVQFVSCGVGTSGMSRKLSEMDAQLIGAYASEDDQLPGIRSRTRLELVPLFDASLYDYLVEVDTESGFSWSKELCRHGIPVATTSGASCAAALAVCESLKKRGELDARRGPSGTTNVVAVLHDLAFLYLEKYSIHRKKRELRAKDAAAGIDPLATPLKIEDIRRGLELVSG